MSKIDDLRAAIERIESGASSNAHTKAPKRRPAEILPSDDLSDMPDTVDAVPGGEKTVSEALAKITRILSYSEKSSKQIRDRLARDGFSESVAGEALERAQSCGLVDDERYAECLVRSRLRQGRGIKGIERELEEAGMALSDLRGWPEDFEYDDNEVDRAVVFLETHPPHSKNPRASAFRKLVSKGFSSSCASSAARIWSEREC